MSHWDDTESDAFDAWEGQSLSARAIAARPAPYLAELNPSQREAVEAMEGPVLVLAGAGTGKTKALTTRIAHLLNTGRARPNEILAVTFTNKAAREMKLRIGAHVGGVIEGMPWLGTFHSICVKLLRRHAELISAQPTGGAEVLNSEPLDEDEVIDSNELGPYDQGHVPPPPHPEAPQRGSVKPEGPHLKPNFTILDTDDQLRLLKQLIRAKNIDEKRWPARMLAGLIDRWKNRAWTPDKVPASEAGAYNNRGVEIYAQYQERLLVLNAVDFGDLLLHVVLILQKHPDVLGKYQRWFKYILVDEYQDTNVAQYLWLRLLAGGHKNICCVGDDDQSIYGWRGAEVGNILKFEKDFPGAKVVRLEQNYRSTPHILAAASGVIAGNEDRLGKTLWTEIEEGEKPRLIGHWDGEEEARWIGEEIESYQRGTRGLDPVSLNDQAILVRASFQMRAFEDRFLTIGMPYRVIGGPRFYERLEIRDAMAYFRVIVSPDDGLAFERIVNTPKRGIGDKAQQQINQIARDNGVSLLDAARIAVDEAKLTSKARNELSKLCDSFAHWREMLVGKELDHVELAEIVLDESGYTGFWKNDKSTEAPGRLENLKELVKALEEFENLQGFLEHVSLVMENEQEGAEEKVSIMTLHAAKGLEFECVYLPGWEDGLFPSQRTMDESGLKGVEEERRLAYVGITRARKYLTICFVANRRVYNQWQSALPSRFVDELPADSIEVLTPPGLYGGSGASGMEAPSEFRGSDLAENAAKADVYNSPGWKRMQSRSAQRGLSLPRETRNLVIDAEAISEFGLGERVFHQKFGYGAVVEIEGDKLTIEFEKAGTKKVVASFVSPSDAVPF